MARAKKKTIDAETKYSKERLVNCRKYARCVDIVSAVLEEDKKYTFEETNALITKFMKGEM